ncbi:hypothetical protein K8R66_02420 [bacterium]|nr:hypothetical protein [bacterium]
MVSANPIINNTRFVGAFGTFTDITEHKNNEETLKRNKEMINLLNKILRHDLANNLAVIRSAISIYERKNDKKMLTEIKKTVDKSISLINKVKNLGEKKNLGLYDLRGTIDNLRCHYPDIVIDITGDSKVIADEKIFSIFDNLFSNANNHGNAKKINITITENKSQNNTKVKVNNNGKDINKNIINNIFEDGIMDDTTGNTGIGLAIVKQTMKIYGGSAEAINTKNGPLLTLVFKNTKIKTN